MVRPLQAKLKTWPDRLHCGNGSPVFYAKALGGVKERRVAVPGEETPRVPNMRRARLTSTATRFDEPPGLCGPEPTRQGKHSTSHVAIAYPRFYLLRRGVEFFWGGRPLPRGFRKDD
jgi:hypothetical protein